MKTKYFLLIAFLVLILFTLISCEKMPVSANTITHSNHNQVIEKTSLAVDAEEELYYENVSRFLPFYDESGISAVVHDYRRIGDRYYVLYFPRGSMHMILAEFTLDGQKCGEKIVSDQVIGGLYSIYDPDSIIVMMPDYKELVIYLKRYSIDGELLETSYAIDQYLVGLPKRLLVLDNDCVCLANGYDMWFFFDLAKKPTHVEAPCLVTYMEKVAEDEYRVFGREGTIGDYIIGTINPKEHKGERFIYSKEMENANGLFVDALYSVYMHGEYYSVCA
ncbi:MAG: hypothetical protein MJ175_12470, partial [Clostridia bacterium]|nr:hypothetical protein [Clostridia bacterium]